MRHLVHPLQNVTYAAGLAPLQEALEFLVERARAAATALSATEQRWGISAKRLTVDLAGRSRPSRIGKDSERLVEVINMAATLERLIDGIEWFSKAPEFEDSIIGDCHPSTSSRAGENDLVLKHRSGKISARCEVTDIASYSANQNAKEKSDLERLGCIPSVPTDGVRRFICTSSEFADALTSPRRKWASYHHRYQRHATQTDTIMLEVLPKAGAAQHAGIPQTRGSSPRR